MKYDYVVVGGGIGGLYLGWYLSRVKTKTKIAILEQGKTVGGRVSTKYDDTKKLNYELGAGRVSSQNRILLELIRHFNLTLTPLDSTFQWSDGQTTLSFPQVMSQILPIMMILQLVRVTTMKQELVQKTIQEILLEYLQKETVDRFLEFFPYTSEIVTENAYDGFRALDSFGFHHNFYLVKEGLSAVIEGLTREFIKNGGEIVTNAYVVNLEQKLSGWSLFTNIGDIYNSKQVIFTCNFAQLIKIRYFNERFGKLVKMCGIRTAPLLRIYVNYPIKNNQKKVWFAGLPRTVTSLPLRLVIPIDASCGVVMVSYTDGPDAEWWWPYIQKWFEGDRSPLLLTLQKQLETLFPGLEIPSPISVTPCYWKEGGNFNVPNDLGWTSHQIKKEVESRLPKGIYVTNNDLSYDKNWIEGSLVEVQYSLAKLAY